MPQWICQGRVSDDAAFVFEPALSPLLSGTLYLVQPWLPVMRCAFPVCLL